MNHRSQRAETTNGSRNKPRRRPAPGLRSTLGDLGIGLVIAILLVLPGRAADDWRPPPPTAQGGFDWIELKSGEWLKGKIKSMQDEKLEFDSEELDLLSFDWKDIRTVRSPRYMSVWFDAKNEVQIEGSLLVTTNQAYVISQTSTNSFARSELLAITPSGQREYSKWTGKLSVGLNIRTGNTKEVDYSSHATLQRRTPSTHLLLDYLGNFGAVNEVKTENNQRITGQFDYFLSRRLFLRVPFVEYFSDPLQNLDSRVTLGAGLGYDLIHNRRVEWEASIAPAYQKSRFVSVEPGEDLTSSTPALVLGTRLDVELNKRLDFILEYRGQFAPPENGENSQHAVATLEFEIHKRFTLDVSMSWDRTGDPNTKSDGTTPNKDDVRLTLGLGVDF